VENAFYNGLLKEGKKGGGGVRSDRKMRKKT